MTILLRLLSVMLTLSPGILLAQSHSEHRLDILADTPVVNIETREAGKDFIHLPSLHYDLEISKRCVAGFTPAVLSLSVADTRRSFSADAISVSENLAIQFIVPAAQIGPVTVTDFCLDIDNPIDAGNRKVELLNISAVLSLQASLLCANETESQITYLSTSLNVALQCDRSVADMPSATN